MKRFLNIITGLALFLCLVQPGLAEFTVVPGEGYDRQFNMEIDPGGSIKASIVVKNLGNDPITIKLYGADATHSNQGTFALTTLDTEQKHIGTWTKFDSSTETIGAKEEKHISFSVIVPKNVTPGNYAGGIAVETISPDAKGNSNAVSVSARIFVKIFVDVPGEKSFLYEWGNFNYLPGDKMNHPRFDFSFKNTGNTIVLAEPKITLKGFPPLKNPILELPTATLQPGVELENVQKKWEDAPFLGLYFAEAAITFSEFDIVSNTKIKSATITKMITINLTPWYIIAIIGLAILIATVLLIRNRFIKIKLIRQCQPYEVTSGETITSIAKERGVDWKKLAKLNKIKAPYTLTVGQKILAPPVQKQ